MKFFVIKTFNKHNNHNKLLITKNLNHGVTFILNICNYIKYFILIKTSPLMWINLEVNFMHYCNKHNVIESSFLKLSYNFYYN